MRIQPILVGISLAGCTTSVHAASPELRGTWVTTTGLTGANGTIRDPAAVVTNFQRLRDIGLNSVYMDTWRNGYTQFPSPTLQATIGVSKDPAIGSRDLLMETSIQAHRNGMAVIGWFQYGFAAKFGNPGTSSTELAKYMADRNWLLKNQSGGYTDATYKFSWMNPLVPQVRSFLTNVVLDAVKQYDLDGLQFDDRLAWPVDYGYDTYTQNVYFTETGRQLPADPSDSQFKSWRAQKITDFSKQFFADLKRANPRLIVSVAPSTYPFSYDSYCANWPSWAQQTVTIDGASVPLFDEILPQVYRSTASGFVSEWNSEVASMPSNRRGDLGAGISINNSSGVAYDWLTINKPQVDAVRGTSGVAGHVWWYSEGVLNTDEAQLTGYYNVASLGQAPRPDQSAGHRPAPVVATHGSGSTWTAPISSKYRYAIVYTTGGAWTVLSNSVYFPGTLMTNITGATQVEVLLDQRPFLDGDANLDNAVNSGDFNTLAGNFGQSGKLWFTGEFTGDGSVNSADFNVLAGNFGKTIGGASGLPGSSVPEPAIAILLLPLFFVGRRR